MCAQGKASHRPDAEMLCPLTVPTRPWSHIALDFVTGLPPSKSDNIILTIVDRFSKAGHFVALAKLPATHETAKFMVQHVFRLHGIPSDIISDQGPQFISQVWKAFCSALGASVSSNGGQPVHLVSALRLRGSVSEPIRTRKRLSLCSSPESSHLELPGWNMPTTPFPALLLVCYLLSLPFLSNHLCFQHRREKLECLRDRPIFDTAVEFGEGLPAWLPACHTTTCYILYIIFSITSSSSFALFVSTNLKRKSSNPTRKHS